MYNQYYTYNILIKYIKIPILKIFMKYTPLFKKPNFNFKYKIRGYLYFKQQDFIVREISLDGDYSTINYENNIDILKGNKRNFVECTLVKKGISTFDAVYGIAEFLGIEPNEIGYCGLKDTYGITAQQISIPSKVFLNNLKKLKSKRFNNFFLKNPRFVNTPKALRQISGNNFQIKIRDCLGKNKDIVNELAKLKKRLLDEEIPNYYGHQRFGINQSLHVIGKNLIKKDYHKALKLFCTYSNNEAYEIKKLRNELELIWGKWNGCYSLIKNIKKGMNYEKKIFQYLINNPEDYIGALNQTPLLKFMINSYNSYLYNLVLKNLQKKGLSDFDYLPLIGYKTKIKDKRIEEEYIKILRKEKVNLEDYKNNEFPILSYPGRDRKAFYKVTDFDFVFKKDCIILNFNLPMGVYSNLFLESFIQNRTNIYKLN